MALVYCMGGGSCPCSAQKSHLSKPHSFASLTRSPPPLLIPYPPSRSGGGGRSDTHIARARRGISSRTRRLENRGRKGVPTTNPLKEGEEGEEKESGEGISSSSSSSFEGGVGAGAGDVGLPPMPELPGEKPNFWEGPQWDAFGFIVQYLWAFGFGFALIACGIAVATYNEGATDFKQTPAYKESILSGELLEEPEGSSSDVFEANPTEDAPSLE